MVDSTPASHPDVADSTDGAAAPAGGTASAAAESRTRQLYRAALGPVNTARYLEVFERFDTLGRHPLVWHPAAGLCTFGWLLFRRLWPQALLYVLIAAGLASLLFSQWPLVRSWPPGVQAGLFGVLLLLAVLVPGLTGYALVHRDVQRRLLRTVVKVKSMDEALTALSQHAASPQHLQLLVGGHVVLLLGVLLVWGPGSDPQGGDAAPVVARVEPAVPSVAPTPATDTATPTTALPAPSPTVAAEPAPSPPVPDPPTDVGLALPERVAAADAGPGDVSPPVPGSQANPAAASGVAEPVTLPALASPPVTAPVPEASAPVSYAINVGLFAEEANARRAHDRLRQAGLPATMERTASPKGERTRVRVGPFSSKDAADTAAQRIRGLGLDALVFRRSGA